jgi:hypothetical protein
MAYTVMSSGFGIAYARRAGEGFGLFEASMEFSRFIAPLVRGILWDFLTLTTPFILVGSSGFIHVPIYAYGISKYEEVFCNEQIIQHTYGQRYIKA